MLGKETLQDITSADCERVLAKLRDEVPSAANDALRYLKRIFACAKRRHLTTASPVAVFDPTPDGGGKESSRSRAIW
jgi:hypothetical protein